MAEMPQRTIRIPDSIWDAAQRKADKCGTTVSEVVRKGLEQWVTRPPVMTAHRTAGPAMTTKRDGP